MPFSSSNAYTFTFSGSCCVKLSYVPGAADPEKNENIPLAELATKDESLLLDTPPTSIISP
jgi:hypothetical protein